MLDVLVFAAPVVESLPIVVDVWVEEDCSDVWVDSREGRVNSPPTLFGEVLPSFSIRAMKPPTAATLIAPDIATRLRNVLLFKSACNTPLAYFALNA